QEPYEKNSLPRIGTVRSYWKDNYRLDLDSLVHPTLFRILCSYLDQGIAMWNFPVWHKGFLSSIREMERVSFTSFFKTKQVRQLLLEGKCGIEFLLDKVVGDPSLYEHYLYDQQFAHQGWSGMVSAIEDNPDTLLDHRKVTIHNLISFELLLELDAITHQLGKDWKPLGQTIVNKPTDLFAEVPTSELNEALMMFQEAYEWTYYNAVLSGLQKQEQVAEKTSHSFQAMFCIDDRECSIRRYLEKFDPACQTFGTPGFFGVEFFYKPEHGKFLTKLCPAPVTPKYLIKETEGKSKQQKDLHFTKHTHSLFRGWLITQTLGFWSAVKLFINIFRPSVSPATATSFRHMDKFSKLTIENHNTQHRENDLQVGFTIEEMANRVEGLLSSIGLVKDFASIVYVVGHGSSSVNNPHFAAYDCGACSGRPGSVNARVICHMANHKQVRNILASRGIEIPDTTQFVGALHDTTRDEILFFDEASLSDENKLR
ncbi:MAG: Na-translocating system protein MpsB, partial [Cyclobacteriaceae bacterium]|nr:Na-translocating system protein MpsB [Cyclobacteriaceae bacterium]